ncbi:calcium/proton exchanger [Gonapodya prolifera JEL478]|uniref:Vacuolar calcium ion transporter n=1 Tax=Gonapodya prolifera (strain JEL478) TaxID=1344416 RepID=A0A139AVA9_GONPJ|nr:calcium/proton exchanger [Gonapodya prolifera JEL478]|eukprot:KXS20647.1 calcium/proton exchanger [Gonapodya prolifera JEL478]
MPPTETSRLLPSNHTSEEHSGSSPTVVSSLHAAATQSWLNVLLVFVPVGIAAGVLSWGPQWIFTFNFLAILPLAQLLGFATEEIALRTSQTIGGLLNATFGNAGELLILGVAALQGGLVRIVQASLIGSILSNLLFVAGLCFFVAGLRYKEARFAVPIANISGSLLSLALAGILLPGAFFAQLVANPPSKEGPTPEEQVVNVSRGASIILLGIYFAYLYFQLHSHKHLFEDPEGEEEAEEPKMNFWVAVILLAGSTVIIAVCAEYLVGSIEGISEEWGLTKSFVGLVLLPIVGNAAEHLTAVTVAYKNKLGLSLGISVGSALQIAMFVGPVLVLTGWAIGVPLTLEFGVFETAVSFVSVFIVVHLIDDGATNYLEGLLLLGTYAITCIAFWYMP